MSELVQCTCGGWMSPRAIYCPTCGAPVADDQQIDKTMSRATGWRIVNCFWMSVLLAILLIG